MDQRNQTEQSHTPPFAFEAPNEPSNSPEEAYPYRHTPSQRPKKEYSFTPIEKVFAWAALLLGFLLARGLPIWEHPLGNLLVTLLFFGAGLAFVFLSGKRPRPRQYVFFALSMLFSVSHVTSGNGTVRLFVSLFLTLVFCSWIYDCFGGAGERLEADRVPAHLYQAALKYPFAALGALFPALTPPKDGRLKNTWRTVGFVLVGLFAAVIPTAIIWGLLSYDEQFNSIMKELFSFSMDGFWETLWDLILGIPVALLLFSLLYTARSRTETELPRFERLHRMPKALLCAAVTPILALYVIFFISQWGYYVSAFTHVLPEGLTYATYAREGFFQLCTVCGINAAILLVFHLLVRRNEEERHSVITKIYFAVISLFTLILIATALSKMLLYIDSYGLTQKRVYASWLMLLLTLVFLCVLIRQLTRRFPAMAVGLIGAVVLFGLIALPNVDAMIADYNVSAYLSGELPEADVEVLEELELSSVPARVRLETALKAKESLTQEEATLLELVTASLNRTKTMMDYEKTQNGPFSTSIPLLRAESALEERQ